MPRRERVEEAIKQEVGSIMQNELKDPRIGFATVTRVEMSADLKYAKIFVSVLGKQDNDKSTFTALEKAKGYIRRLIAQRLQLRFVPELSFREDNSAEYSVYIAQKIDELKNEEKPDKPNKRISKKP